MKTLLRRLPDISILRNRCRAMAMLDAVLSPEWEARCYSFNNRWGEGEQIASMRNGSGDDWFIVFSAFGVYGRGFNHERPNAPTVLDTDWGVSAADHGDHGLFELLVDGTPEGYRKWARDYYEVEVSLAAIQHVYALLPLTLAVVAGLNPDVDLIAVEPDMIEIGYPH